MSELHQDLRLLRNESDAATRKEWNRSVPFPEALFDRWERARVLGFGEGSSLFDSCLLYTSPSPRDQRGSRMPSSA